MKINQHSLNCLPEHGVPRDIISVETDVHTETYEPDFGPQNAEDTVYNEQTEMNSFLPIPQCEYGYVDSTKVIFSFRRKSYKLPQCTTSIRRLAVKRKFQ